MTTSTPSRSAARVPDGGARRATRTEELTYLFFVSWTLVGLCLDGWAHRNRPELESFFTPWHAVFYSGFTGVVVTLAVIVIRRRPFSPSLIASIPPGYRPAVAGLAVFAVGGAGDGIWHTVFGVESSLDALLSPTHLLMLVGILAGGTAPLRSAWHDPNSAVEPSGIVEFLVPVLAVALTTTGVAFFFLYANGFNNWPMTEVYNAESDSSETTAALGILSTLASTLILLAPVNILLRRWRPPLGTFTALFSIVGVFMAGLDAFEFSWQIIAPIVGGLLADLVVASSLSARHRALLIGALVPLVMWTVSTFAIHLAWGVEWPPELWVGNIVMAVLGGMALAYTANPPRPPVALDAGLF